MKKDQSQDVDVQHIDVEYVARLARLSLSGDEITAFTRQLEQILVYFDQLKRVDVKDVEPMSYPIPLQNVLRADDPATGPQLETDEIANNAPQWQDGTFMVPRIIE